MLVRTLHNTPACAEANRHPISSRHGVFNVDDGDDVRWGCCCVVWHTNAQFVRSEMRAHRENEINCTDMLSGAPREQRARLALGEEVIISATVRRPRARTLLLRMLCARARASGRV